MEVPDSLYKQVCIVATSPNFILLAVEPAYNGVVVDGHVQYRITDVYPAAAKFETPWFIHQADDNLVFIGIELKCNLARISFNHHIDLFLFKNHVTRIPLLQLLTVGPTAEDMCAKSNTRGCLDVGRQIDRTMVRQILSSMIDPQSERNGSDECVSRPAGGELYPVCESTYRVCYPRRQQFDTMKLVGATINPNQICLTGNAAMTFHMRAIEIAAWEFYGDALRSMKLDFVEGLYESDVEHCYARDAPSARILDWLMTTGGPPLFSACMARECCRQLEQCAVSFPFRTHAHELIEDVRKSGAVTGFYSPSGKTRSSMFYRVCAGDSSGSPQPTLTFYDLGCEHGGCKIGAIDAGGDNIGRAFAAVRPHVIALASFLGYSAKPARPMRMESTSGDSTSL